MVLREKVSEVLDLKIDGSEMLYLLDNWSAWCMDVDRGYPFTRKYANVDSIIKEDIESKRIMEG